MTQTEKELVRQWVLPKKIVIAGLCLLFCFTSIVSGLAGERAKVMKNVKQIKAQAEISPQQRMRAVYHYLYRLSEPQLMQLSQEIGGERFLKEILSATKAANMNPAEEIHWAEKMKRMTKSNPKKGGQGENQHVIQQKELQACLRSPETRKRYLNAVAGYLLNTTR